MRVSDLGHPRHIDVVAADFPELKIVMSHAGLSVGARGGAARVEVPERLPRAGRAPAAATSPRPGTGWEPLLRFGHDARSRTRSCSAPAGSCSGARRARSSTSSARCRCPRTCWSCGCRATPSALLGASPSPLRRATRLLGLARPLLRRRLALRPRAARRPAAAACAAVRRGALASSACEPLALLGRHVGAALVELLVARDQLGPVLAQPLEEDVLHLAAQVQRAPRRR